MSDAGSPREQFKAQVAFLAREADRQARRLAVMRQHAEDLHGAWSALAGGSLNQHAVDVLLHLADVESRLNDVTPLMVKASDEMRAYGDGI